MNHSDLVLNNLRTIIVNVTAKHASIVFWSTHAKNQQKYFLKRENINQCI